jgi:hypothetical protein
MNTLTPQLRIANTAAVLEGPYGSVTRQASRCGTSHQALYRDAPKVLQAVAGTDAQRCRDALQDELDAAVPPAWPSCTKLQHQKRRQRRHQRMAVECKRHRRMIQRKFAYAAWVSRCPKSSLG